MATLASSQGLTSMPSFSAARPPSWRASMAPQSLPRPLSMQPFEAGLNTSRPMSMQPLAARANHSRPVSFQPFATTVNQPRPQSGQDFDPAELCRRLKMHERQQKDQDEKKRIRASQVIEGEQYQHRPQFDSIDFGRTSSVSDRFSKRDVQRLAMLEEEENVGPSCESSSSGGEHALQRKQHLDHTAAQLEGPRPTGSISRAASQGRHTTVDFSSPGSQAGRPISHFPAGKGHARALSTGDASRGTNIAEVIEQQHQAAEAAKKPRFSYMCEEGLDWNQGEEADESMQMYPSRNKRHSKFKELFVPPSVWFVNKSSSTLASPTRTSSSAAPTQDNNEASSNTAKQHQTQSLSTESKNDLDTGTSTTQNRNSFHRKRKSAFFLQRASFTSSSAPPTSQLPPASPPTASSSSSPTTATAPAAAAAAAAAAAPSSSAEGGTKDNINPNKRRRKSGFFKDLFRKSEGKKKWRWH